MQRSSWRQDSSAGERNERIRARHSARNSGSGGTTAKRDPARLAPRGGDRRVGVRHELGDDLHQVDSALGEVLAEVAPPHATQANRRRIKCRCRRHGAQCREECGRNDDDTVDGSVRRRTYRVSSMSEPTNSVRVSNEELATVREAMRELHRLLSALDDGDLEKVVLTQRNQMRAVLITLERYTELEQRAA